MLHGLNVLKLLSCSVNQTVSGCLDNLSLDMRFQEFSQTNIYASRFARRIHPYIETPTVSLGVLCQVTCTRFCPCPATFLWSVKCRRQSRNQTAVGPGAVWAAKWYEICCSGQDVGDALRSPWASPMCFKVTFTNKKKQRLIVGCNRDGKQSVAPWKVL